MALPSNVYMFNFTSLRKLFDLKVMQNHLLLQEYIIFIKTLPNAQ